MKISIHTSHEKYGCGFVIDESGNVLKATVHESFGPVPVEFDTAEFLAYYGKLEGSIDVLDIGYTLPDGTVEPPEWDYRKTYLVEGFINSECPDFDNWQILNDLPDVRLGNVDLDRAEYARLIREKFDMKVSPALSSELKLCTSTVVTNTEEES